MAQGAADDVFPNFMGSSFGAPEVAELSLSRLSNTKFPKCVRDHFHPEHVGR